MALIPYSEREGNELKIARANRRQERVGWGWLWLGKVSFIKLTNMIRIFSIASLLFLGSLNFMSLISAIRPIRLNIISLMFFQTQSSRM